MEGLGNDYIYVNLLEEKARDYSRLSKKLSDRHFGIGSDGIITIDKSQKADYKMRIYNADGSEAKMCGNGIRCVGKYLYDNKLVNNKEITIETLSGIKKLTVKTEYGIVKQVTVDMGIPKLEKIKKINIKNKECELIYISIGNPHAVMFVKDLNDSIVNELGPLIQKYSNVNVEFVKVMDKQNLFVRVYERGSKETLACGTGACAAAVAYMYNNKIKGELNVKLPGGTLHITWKDNNHVYMKGPANKVYEGEINV